MSIMMKKNPLHQAISAGKVVDFVTLCAGEKKLLEDKDSWGRTPLDLAAYEGQVEMVEVLIRSGANKTSAILRAAENGKIDVVRLLVEKRANLRVTQDGNVTALHLAARDGHVEVIKTLLDEKVDVDAVTIDNETPLHEAAWNGHLEAVNMLIGARADYRILTSDGMSVLHKAATRPLHHRSTEELFNAKLAIIEGFVKIDGFVEDVPPTLQNKIGVHGIVSCSDVG